MAIYQTKIVVAALGIVLVLSGSADAAPKSRIITATILSELDKTVKIAIEQTQKNAGFVRQDGRIGKTAMWRTLPRGKKRSDGKIERGTLSIKLTPGTYRFVILLPSLSPGRRVFKDLGQHQIAMGHPLTVTKGMAKTMTKPGERDYGKCPFCGQRFLFPKRLGRHLDKNHSNYFVK